MRQFVVWTETHHVFSVTAEYYLKKDPEEELAEDKGNSSFIQLDVVALASKCEKPTRPNYNH